MEQFVSMLPWLGLLLLVVVLGVTLLSWIYNAIKEIKLLSGMNLNSLLKKVYTEYHNVKQQLFSGPVKIYVYNHIPFGVLHSSVELGHSGIGIVINKRAKIGKNVYIGQNVTIGTRADACPIIEDNVKIHANSCIIGGITIGHDSIVGAGATVTMDVPPHSLVVEYDKIYKDKYRPE